MRISVVIPTYNRRDLLARTLPTVLNQDFPSDQYEVIVVVDGSTDGTLEFLRSLSTPCALRIVEQPNRGIAAARNAGLRVARADIVLFLDDDILSEPSLLQEHARAHENGAACVAFGPPVSLNPEGAQSLTEEWVDRLWEAYRADLSRAPAFDPLRDTSMDSNRSGRRSVLLEAGGYDETLAPMGFVTLDFGLRLWKQGVRFRFLPRAVTRQIYVNSSRQLLGTFAVWFGRSEVRICRRHREFRPFSNLGAMAEGGPWKRFRRMVMVRQPVEPELLSRAPLALAERLRYIPLIRRLGVLLVGKTYALADLRGAVLEAGSWGALASEFGVRLPVFMYHNVGPYRPGTVEALTVSPERFQQQMRWLAHHGYTGISAGQWVEWREKAKPLPAKPVLLTFDDAYEDIVEHALPVVRALGFSATVFVVTQRIGQTNVWDEMRGRGTLKVMSASQIKEWAEKGIEFGAHSRTHPFLTTLDEAGVEAEVAGSQDDLARLLGTPPVSFAYPYGDMNDKVQASAARNFRAAFTIEEGMNTLRTDPAALRRSMIWPANSLADVALKLRLGKSPLENLPARLKHAVSKRWRALFD